MSEPRVTLRPDPAAWADLARAHHAKPSRWKAARGPAGLGDGPIVMSGHQPQIWHAGILAKYLAAGALAKRVGGTGAWLVVDHDEVEPLDLWYPALAADGAFRKVIWSPPMREGPARARASVVVGEPETTPAPDFAPRLARLIDALRDAAGESPNACAQVTLALTRLLDGLAQPLRTIEATSLRDSLLLGELVARMKADPRGCIERYNAAAAGVPQARLRPLEKDELPLWRLVNGQRVGVRTGDVDAPGSLVPRALLLTGMARLGLCDLFIHGVGGEVYDRATEHWFEHWLGDDACLAPSVMVSATVLPNLPVRPIPPEQVGNRITQKIRALEFEPLLVGDRTTAAQKALLLAEIREAPRHSEARARAYQALHRLLEVMRLNHAATIERLRSGAHALRDSLVTDPATDRTLPFPLHEPVDLQHLAAMIDGAVGA